MFVGLVGAVLVGFVLSIMFAPDHVITHESKRDASGRIWKTEIHHDACDMAANMQRKEGGNVLVFHVMQISAYGACELSKLRKKFFLEEKTK